MQCQCTSGLTALPGLRSPSPFWNWTRDDNLPPTGTASSSLRPSGGAEDLEPFPENEKPICVAEVAELLATNLMPDLVLRDYRLNHTLRLGGRVISQGKCELHLDDTFLLIKGDRSSRVGYEQLESFRQTPDGVEIQMFPEGSIRFDGMDGALVRPLFVHLSRLRGLRWAYLLRYTEGAPIDTLECKVRLSEVPEQEALVHLYTNGLVGMPFGGELFQLPMADLQSTVRTPDYQLVCSTDELTATLYGCEPTYLGRFQRAIETERQKMEEETSNLLVELFPALELSQTIALTTLLARGRAASKSRLDQAVPWLWERIEELVQTKASYPESYSELKGRAGEYLWFGLRRSPPA